VLIDRVDSATLQARGPWQADDIDGVTYVSGGEGVLPGTFADVMIDDVVEDVDFAASLVSVIRPAPAPPRVARLLPVLGTVGSFGR
jgi:hypothetical protein